MTFTIFFVTTSYQSLKLVTLTYNEVTVTNLRIHYTVVIEKLVNVTKQCSDVHYIVFTVYLGYPYLMKLKILYYVELYAL